VRPSRRDALVGSLAAAVVVAGAVEARRGTLRALELRTFSHLNGLSDRAHRPVWGFMQVGSLAGAGATGAVVARRNPRLGRRLAVVGAVAWASSKAVKPFARRGRPASVLEARVLGRPQAGLGYPSGHAAVSAAMAAVAAPHVPPRWVPVLWAGAVGIGATRAYVGAHLPLDVVGGVALGVAVERTVRAVSGPA
jgi:glycosyltransferase 2 family protein